MKTIVRLISQIAEDIHAIRIAAERTANAGRAAARQKRRA